MKRVLVVEDEPAIRDLLVWVLQIEGYEVSAAENGRRAIEMAQHDPPDLMLLDLMMPGMDGYEVLQHLRDSPRLRAVPVVVMSAAARPESSDTQVKAFVAKPFDLDDLLGIVKAVLAEAQSS